MTTQLVKRQTITKQGSFYENGQQWYVVAEVRHDDRCGNNHNTFSIAGSVYSKEEDNRKESRVIDGITWYYESGGCVHDEIVKAIPALAPYIKWHLCSTDGPMHYIANTLYHAGDRDCNGLRKDETRQLRNGKTGLLSWKLQPDGKLPDVIDSATQPTDAVTYSYKPWNRIGEGKERELDVARSSAIWAEATDEQLALEPRELEKLLIARLPQLMLDFRNAVESLGLVY